MNYYDLFLSLLSSSPYFMARSDNTNKILSVFTDIFVVTYLLSMFDIFFLISMCYYRSLRILPLAYFT